MHRTPRAMAPSVAVRAGRASLSPGARAAWMIVLTVIYAFCFVAIKAGLTYAPPLLFAALRVLVAGVALLGVAAIRRAPLAPPRRLFPWLLALAVTATTIVYGAMFLSPGRTGAGIASVFGNAQPLFTVVLAAVFLGERITLGKSVALGFGIVGVTLIAYPALTGPGAYGISGAALALAVSGGSAAGNVIVKRMGPLPSLLTTTAWALLLGGAPLLIASVVAERGQRVLWNLPFIGLTLFLALPGTAFTTALWYWLIQRDTVGRLVLYFFLIPVLGLLLAMLIFGERVGPLEALGVLATLVGIGAVIWESRAHH